MSSSPDPDHSAPAGAIDKDGEEELVPLPAGSPNYMTPAGFRRLDDELKQLSRVERPKVVEVVSWAAGNGDRSENGDYIYGKRRLREIDRRIRFLRKRLEICKVVDPAQQTNRDRVFFGATVTYAAAQGGELTVKIVGVDEADFEQGQISWVSPIARALLRGSIGDSVKVKTPAGLDTIEILAIAYDNGRS